MESVSTYEAGKHLERKSRGLSLEFSGVGKDYDLRPVIGSFSCSLRQGEVLGITGSNGSGKSTLIRMAANVLERSRGDIRWVQNGTELSEDDLPAHIGFVAPYLSLYTEFSLLEQGEIIASMRGNSFDKENFLAISRTLGIDHRIDDLLSAFSSGMLQRARLILALFHRPSFLFLDEPMNNLDRAGIDAFRSLITDHSRQSITLIATNDPEDLELCTKVVNVE